MDARLNIAGLFRDSRALRDAVENWKICYDYEPYYINHKGQLLQIGFQINLYGALPPGSGATVPEEAKYSEVERDLLRLAEALVKTCNPSHMCESAVIDPATISKSPERKMRPELAVHIPIFDQKDFGHPVDAAVRETLLAATALLEAAGVRKSSWKNR